jgi:hypothetical protein
MTDEERNKIFAEIDFEKKWLIEIIMERGSISIGSIDIAMDEIKRVVNEVKGE